MVLCGAVTTLKYFDNDVGVQFGEIRVLTHCSNIIIYKLLCLLEIGMGEGFWEVEVIIYCYFTYIRPV